MYVELLKTRKLKGTVELIVSDRMMGDDISLSAETVYRKNAVTTITLGSMYFLHGLNIRTGKFSRVSIQGRLTKNNC